MKGAMYMFNKFKKKQTLINRNPKREEYLRIIREAEEKGIYVPGKYRRAYERRYKEPKGMNCWGLSLEKRAEYAARKLKELEEES